MQSFFFLDFKITSYVDIYYLNQSHIGNKAKYFDWPENKYFYYSHLIYLKRNAVLLEISDSSVPYYLYSVSICALYGEKK